MLAAACGVAIPALCAARGALGQVSGTWVLDANGNWSSGANWTSNPSFPSAGGVATFGGGSVFYSAGRTATLDTPVTLSSVVFNTPFPFTIAPGAALTLSGPATVTTTDGPSASVVTADPLGHTLGAAIGGSAGLNVSGNSALMLTGTSSFTGGVTISGVAVYVRDGNNAAFGNASNPITLSNGAALGHVSSSGFTLVTARSIILGSGGGQLLNLAPITITGTISGAGALTSRSSTGTLTLAGANAYTGATTIRDNGAVILTGPSGAIASSAQLTLAGSIVLDNLISANTNRIGTVPITSTGGSMQLTGNASTIINEAVGAVTLSGGQSVFNLVKNSAATSLTANSLTRSGQSTVLVRGDNLGSGAPAGNVTNFVLNAAPTLVGGGGAAGTSTISIVPWIVGNNTSGNTLNAADNTFVTYSNPNGFRPLNLTTEYAQTLAGAGATTNVRLTAPATVSSPQTINSLLIGSATANLSGSSQLTIASGAVLTTVLGTTHSVPLNFGSAEGIFHTTSSATFSGAISGTGGLTKSGANTLTLTGNSTYTGQTTIVAGTLKISSTVNSGVAGPLGASSSPVVMQGAVGVALPRLYGSTDVSSISVFRPMTIDNATPDSTAAIGMPAGSVAGRSFNYGGGITVNGGVLRLEAEPGTPLMGILGVHGSGRVTDAFGSAQVVGSSDYTGGTQIQAGDYFAADSAAFGTGSILFTNSTAPTGSNPFPGAIGTQGGDRSIANPIFVAAPSPSASNPSLLGVVLLGPNLLTLSGPVDLNGDLRTFTTPAGADATLSGVISRGGLAKSGAGRLTISGSNTYTGDTIVHAGTLVFGRSESNSALSVDTGARAEVAAGGDKTLVIRSLGLSGTAMLDLFDNDLKVANTSYAAIAFQIATARNGGAWNGPAGITSTTARLNAQQNTTLGTLTGAEYASVSGGASFNGFAVAPSDVVVKYTWNGDANLDGRVTFDDYVRIDTGFNTGLTGWLNGDFNYSGSVNFDDYVLIDIAFNSQSGTLRRAIDWISGDDRSESGQTSSGVAMVLEHFELFGSAYAQQFLAAVPEPHALGALILAMFPKLAIRRRRRCRAHVRPLH